MKKYYEILEVEETATLEEIKKAYRAKALEYHPDRVPPRLKKESEELFKEVQNAYDVLSDPEKRKEYDGQLKNPQTEQPFDQTDSPEAPVLEVDKTRFEFKDLEFIREAIRSPPGCQHRAVCECAINAGRRKRDDPVGLDQVVHIDAKRAVNVVIIGG